MRASLGAAHLGQPEDLSALQKPPLGVTTHIRAGITTDDQPDEERRSPMIAAIYARKSTEQTGVADEQKSVARQIEHARSTPTRKGWTVADESRLCRRRDLRRRVCEPSRVPPADERVEAAGAVPGARDVGGIAARQGSDRDGVRAEATGPGRRAGVLLPRGSGADARQSRPTRSCCRLTAFADELEREKARQRTYDAMLRKARAGHVTGGRVFGYDNVEIAGARRHTRRTSPRRINEAEAAVVRRIFELCAAGEGLTRITKALNEDRVPAPRPQQGRPVGWAGSTVRDVLLRPLYRGEIVWNQTRKRDGWGQANRRTRAAGEWLRIPAPELRIVSEDLWHAAQERFTERQVKYAQAGRRRQDIESPYLLSGFARCGTCGGEPLRPRRDSMAGSACGSTAASRSGSAASRVCANNLIGADGRARRRSPGDVAG